MEQLFPGDNTWVPLIAGILDLVLILVIALILRGLAHRLIDRVTRRTSEGTMSAKVRRKTATIFPGSPALLSERRRQRLETMSSVLRHIASIVILGTAALTILGRLGIPIAPLLTSVGIVGVAVGFGAQELVKDFISGMFMLLEDQYGVGDVIDVGPAVGTVEAVTLRITRLRDADGKVWYIRNGTITRVGNDSQGWSRTAVDVPVPYDADIRKVRELLKATVKEMYEDPAFQEEILMKEPDVWGPEEISDSAILFRVSAQTAPGHQVEVARELRMRIKQAFDGAEMAFAG
jgi:small-conductance mechanosensitive channel